MADASTPISGIRLRSPAVDFIDNRLPEYHEAFLNPPTRFDPVSGRYVPALQADMRSCAPHEHTPYQTPRPAPQALDAAHFWDWIFPRAIAAFKKEYPVEPKGRSESSRSIRSKVNWKDVYDQLQEARRMYDDSKGFIGNVKKGFRKAADNIQPTRQVVDNLNKLVPNSNYVSPVLGALMIILDVSCMHKTHMCRAV
jgi:hypothetical protein